MGFTLQKVITPVLRKYNDQQLGVIYQRLEHKHALTSQTFQRHLKQLPGSNRSLDYTNINGNNGAAPRNFDYAIRSHEDFAKLFIRPFMVHFTVIDDRCDLSALLLLIGNIDDNSFSRQLKKVAREVQAIRNDWAHCNFISWDADKLKKSFVSMRNLIQSVCLTISDERSTMDDLQLWEQEGTISISGFSDFFLKRCLSTNVETHVYKCKENLLMLVSAMHFFDLGISLKGMWELSNVIQ